MQNLIPNLNGLHQNSEIFLPGRGRPRSGCLHHSKLSPSFAAEKATPENA
jgi:hypothetical protein